MTEPNSPSSPDDSVAATAARWIARRDRGLNASEQAAYLEWLRQDPRHEAAMIRPAKNWTALDQLARHFPVEGTMPDPDLLAPPRRRAWWIWVPALAAAAAVALIYFGRAPVGEPNIITYSNPGKGDGRQSVVRLEPERHTLEDGSVVELNALATVRVHYTPAERRVELVRGEAYFIVAKNPQRPFFVSANQVTVRAVGTAFSVGLGQKDLAVLVTEGKVQVDETPLPSSERPGTPRALSALHAGQQGIFNLVAAPVNAPAPEMEVKPLTPAEVDVALSWRNLQLEFTDLPLGDAVAEFNRHNRQKLVVADPATAAIRVGGIFRADNVAAFVSLLDTGFGVASTTQGETIILRKAHGP